MSAGAGIYPQGKLFPNPGLWHDLLSGNRGRITKAVETIKASGLVDEYAAQLLAARRRDARHSRRRFGIAWGMAAYTERERRSALTALGLLWGVLGRELATALDPKASHFDRERAHKALSRRRDQRAVRPLIDALLDGHALEDWQCIPTLGALGDTRAVDALLQYIGLNRDKASIPDNALLDIGVEVGRALKDLSAGQALELAQEMCLSPLVHQRAGAVLVIAGWGDESLVDLIVQLAQDPAVAVRLSAVTALSELKAAVSISTLQTLADDVEPQVRQAVERTLQQVMLAQSRQPERKSKLKRPNLKQR